MTKLEFLQGSAFELPVPQYGWVYQFVHTGPGERGVLESKCRYRREPWGYFCDVTNFYHDRVEVRGFWFDKILKKYLSFEDMVKLGANY